jgi:hypothetical protein
MSPGLHHRPTDEHMTVPVWRMKQLQDVEQAAREAVELAAHAQASGPRSPRHVLVEVKALLEDALGDE